MRIPRLRFSTTTGASVAVSLFVLVTVVRSGLDAGMGLGPLGDPLFSLGLFVGTAAVMAGVAWLALVVVRRLPAAAVVAVAGSMAAGVLFLGPRDETLLDGILVGAGVVLAAWLGAAVGRLGQVLVGWKGEPGPSAGTKRSVLNAAAAVTTCLVIAGWLLVSPASESLGADESLPRNIEPSTAPHPGARGPHEVEVFTYGSGTDRRRPAYADEVALRTLTLDLRPLLPTFGGFEAQLHRSYWGFGLDSIPLNATVWMPVGDGAFPVVLFIPGIDASSERSEMGYAYLGELLASRGYVVVVTDMNFLGGPHIADAAGDIPVRAWLALKHLEMLGEWKELHPGSRADRIDLDRIVVGGHSRGGEAAALAAKLNSLERYPPNAAIPVAFGFPIEGVFALAPTDRFYPIAGQGSHLYDTSYLVLHGSHDGDVTSFMGTAQYQRASISEGSPAFKSSIYVVGANHSNFNSETSGRDRRGISGLLLDPSRLLDGADQRRMTSVFASAFVESVLRGDTRYLDFFEDPRTGWPWLPETRYLSRFEDGRTRTIASFEEDLGPASTSLPGASIEGRSLVVWREEPLTLRSVRERTQETQVVRVGWNRAVRGEGEPTWEVRLPDALPESLVHPAGRLRFSMGPGSAGAALPELSVELETSDGVRARLDPADFAPEPPAGFPRLWRLAILDELTIGTAENLLQDYVIPFAAFGTSEPGFDPARVRTIRFVFDRDPSGTILLDDIGFRMPAPPTPVDAITVEP